MRITLFLAAVTGLLAMIAGTFAAHGLEDRLTDEFLAIYETGVRYHAYHALALLACAGVVDRLSGEAKIAVWCFAAGIVIFGGSLYALALTEARWLGAITPIGGMAFIGGWALLGMAALKPARAKPGGGAEGV